MRKDQKKIHFALRYTIALGIAAVISGAAPLSVSAAIPDSAGLIHACYRNLTGALRVVDSPSQNCNFLESPIDWVKNPGGRIYTNIVNYSYAESGRVTVLSVPNIGEIQAYQPGCQSGVGQGFFKNSTAEAVSVITNGTVYEIPPNDEIGIFGPFMAYRTAGPVVPVTVSFFAGLKPGENSTDCTAGATAIVKI